MGRYDLMRRCLVVGATILGVLSSTEVAFSETFLALGLPEGGPSHGWMYGYAPTEEGAMNGCRGIAPGTNQNNGISNDPPNASEAHRACKIVGDLKGQCFAFASNGGTTATALGWTIADDEDSAKEGAMNKCAAMTSYRVSQCILRYSYCDKDQR